jgi:hypothetical protein
MAVRGVRRAVGRTRVAGVLRVSWRWCSSSHRGVAMAAAALNAAGRDWGAASAAAEFATMLRERSTTDAMM